MIKFEEKQFDNINYKPSYKDLLIKDLKIITLRCWFLKSTFEVFSKFIKILILDDH